MNSLAKVRTPARPRPCSGEDQPESEIDRGGRPRHREDARCHQRRDRRDAMSLILLVLLLLFVVGGLPTWGYHHYGYGPSGIGGVILLVLVIMLLTGRL